MNKKSESEIQQLIQMEAPQWNCLLLRNNSGALKDINGRLVRYGLGNVSAKKNSEFKSSDLIGIKSVVITADMVGKTVGLFTAIEVKREGYDIRPEGERDTAQFNFIKWARMRGAVAGMVNSVEGFQDLMRPWLRK